MYAVYFSGDNTDVSITGKSHICELMHRGGKLQVSGESGSPGISIGCTTLELSGNAQMGVRHVHLGRLLTWQDEGSMREANVTGEAALVGHDISIRNVRFRTEDSGTVVLRNIERHGGSKFEKKAGESRSTSEDPPLLRMKMSHTWARQNLQSCPKRISLLFTTELFRF